MMSFRIPTTFAAVLVSAVTHPSCESLADAQSRLPVRDTQTITRTLRFAGAAARTLDVRAINGTIRVAAADVPDVQIEVRRTLRAESDSDRDAAGRDVAIEFLDGGSRVGALVRDRGETCGQPSTGGNRSRRERYEVTFDFTIRVPRRTSLRLCTINGGDLVVDGTDGDFEINNINGRITMRNVRGGGTVETINGELTVSFAEPPRVASRFKTLNGDVAATFPANLSADLVLKTHNGELLTDFAVETLPQRPERAQRANGQFVYRSDGSSRVRVGGGGTEIALETFNGDVRVLRAPR